MPRFLLLTKRNAASGVPVFFHLAAWIFISKPICWPPVKSLYINLCKLSLKKLIKFDSLKVCLVVLVVNVYTKHVGTLFVYVTGSTCVSCTVWRQILYFNCKFCFGKCSFSAWVLQRISRDYKISSIYLRKYSKYLVCKTEFAEDFTVNFWKSLKVLYIVFWFRLCSTNFFRTGHLRRRKNIDQS